MICAENVTPTHTSQFMSLLYTAGVSINLLRGDVIADYKCTGSDFPAIPPCVCPTSLRFLLLATGGGSWQVDYP